MTNLEKLLMEELETVKEILAANLYVSDKEVGACDGSHCENCIFSMESNCYKGSMNWLLEKCDDRPYLTAEEQEKWHVVDDGDLPEEKDSIFTKFKNTDKWNNAMFEKRSDAVNVTVEFEDGTRKTETRHMIDGKWNCDKEIVKRKVIAWQPLPKPYEGEVEK